MKKQSPDRPTLSEIQERLCKEESFKKSIEKKKNYKEPPPRKLLGPSIAPVPLEDFLKCWHSYPNYNACAARLGVKYHTVANRVLALRQQGYDLKPAE